MRLVFYSINTNETNNQKTFTLQIVPFKTKNRLVSLLFIFIWLFGVCFIKWILEYIIIFDFTIMGILFNC
jgi:glucan phosphoethanolaminetransferase (alkaline phosphatase superfamily)